MQEYRTERLIYALALLVSVVGVIYLWNQNVRIAYEKHELSVEKERLLAQMDSVRNADRELLPVTRFQPLNEREWLRLVHNGLTQPKEDLFESLRLQAHLIPFDGVHGGTPGFYDKKDFYLLNHRWVLVGFEDGHYYGQMVLSYDVSRDGRVAWEVVSSTLR